MSCWYCTSQSCGESGGAGRTWSKVPAPWQALVTCLACSSVSLPPTHHVPWGPCSPGVGRERRAGPAFAHAHGVHSEVILELGDRDEAVDLGRQSSKPEALAPQPRLAPQLPPARPTHAHPPAPCPAQRGCSHRPWPCWTQDQPGRPPGARWR